jgi:putative membrane protein
LEQAHWPLQAWQPLHPRAWWRLALPGVVAGLMATAVLGFHFATWGLLGLLWLPWSLLVARRHAQRAGFVLEGELVAVREGWWSRHWRFAELDKLQTLRLRRGPLDRHLGMASLWLDTAGAGAFAPPLRIRFLPVAQAEALHARLAAQIARRPLRW